MITFNGKFGRDYGLEIVLFHKLREYSDGITFWESKINWDRYLADHSPKFTIHIVLLNYTLIEINIYYLHHRPIEDEKTIEKEII